MKTNTKTKNLIGLCIATPTEESFKQACGIAYDNGWEGFSISEMFHKYKEESCVYFSETNLQYSPKPHFSKCGYTINSMKDLSIVIGEYIYKAEPPIPPSKPSEVISDGGSTNGYYEITLTNKSGETFTCQMGDVIRATVANDFDLGNIMKACRRISEAVQGRGKSGTNISYDCNKIKYFADEVAHFQGRGKFTQKELDCLERILSDTQIN
jgi:hypothetical protein